MQIQTIGAGRTNPSSDRVRELLFYDAETGVFSWKVGRRGKARPGSAAGTVYCGRYISIRIDGYAHQAHRLAWFYVNNVWPDSDIDHIDGDKKNNRIANLRSVTRTVNQQNMRKAYSSNKCGLLGVYRQKNRWAAEIVVDGDRRRLGSFDTPELAHSAYLSAKREFHAGCTI